MNNGEVILHKLGLIMDHFGIKDPLDIPGTWYVVSETFDGWRHYVGLYRDCVFFRDSHYKMQIFSEIEYRALAVEWKQNNPDWFGYKHQLDSFLVDWEGMKEEKR